MELKDYLHYYMGATFWTNNSEGEVNPETLRFIYPMIEKDKGVKLVLRRLEDMTEEERKQIWQLIIGRSFPNTGDVRWFEENHSSAKRWVMMSGVERVGIEMTGKVWADSDLSHIKFNPHLVTHCLLQQGFDLFGLIPAGLAMDAKTITP